MSRAAREMIRLLVLAASAFALLVGLTWLAHIVLPSAVAQFVLIPFYLAWGLFVVAPWGIGPLGKRLNQAAIDDAKEERERLSPKQPWQ